MAAKHELLEINFSNSRPWKNDRRDIKISAVLGIGDLQRVSMQVDVQNGTKDKRTVLSQTAFSNDTMREFILSNKELEVGENTITVTFKDEAPAADGSGETVFSHVIFVEDRNAFKIERPLHFAAEYHMTGIMNMTPSNGLILKAKGREEGIAVPKNPIEMDGRAKIKNVVVDGDSDVVNESWVSQRATYQQDRGDSVIQKIPLFNIITSDAVLGAYVTEESEA